MESPIKVATPHNTLTLEQLKEFENKYIDIQINGLCSSCGYVVMVCPECKVIHIGTSSNYCEKCDRSFASCCDKYFVGTTHDNICQMCDQKQ